jgi:hypothetical protein
MDVHLLCMFIAEYLHLVWKFEESCPLSFAFVAFSSGLSANRSNKRMLWLSPFRSLGKLPLRAWMALLAEATQSIHTRAELQELHSYFWKIRHWQTTP